MCNFATKDKGGERTTTTVLAIYIKAYPETWPIFSGGGMKKCQGIKSTCAFAMSCELGEVTSVEWGWFGIPTHLIRIGIGIVFWVGPLFALVKEKNTLGNGFSG